MREVAIIGAGLTKFGELWDKSFRDLFVEAGLKAIENAGVDHLDSMYVGTMSGGLFVGQEHIGSLMADYLGQTPIPATRVESACASSGVAFRMAFIEVASGLNDIVLAGGVEKMNDGADVTYALSTAADQEYEVYQGVTFPGLYAMIARAHMHHYGTTREQLAKVAVKNHYNGKRNPNAQFQMEVTVDQVLNSSMVADPLRLLDCSPVSDGASAVVLCPLDVAKKFTDTPVKVIGTGQASDSVALHSRDDLTYLAAVARSAEQAYKMAGVKPGDINVAEVHDCFTIAEICAMEALGFVERGQGGKAVDEGFNALDGKIPINTSGGLKSKGHPVGATGTAQIIEIFEQLCGTAGERQVKNARIGLAQNMGGSGGSSVVHIMEAVQ
ncbi:thiolase domain-containing protein [candidate division KSB1 bacterium]|nr:thiolase domain-containing protein [candidate division KSB1 bacterium]NIR69873.1 thiolase domain-containing protein [candidate division KSB1 bacterium]NIS22992.1 thiolase domain-containing protein [candidate division KSB1 bacterium]NIT69850.1 thiolase domain-containing protein [candidate division KSB1 bacterium]NIU25772.1 thiolase domain-containing protein [candidate division KSB1 bacterium]